MLRGLLNKQLGNDVNSRVVPISQDQKHSLCLHFSKTHQNSLAFDILHMDDRKELPTWVRPNLPIPASKIRGKKLKSDEVSLQEPAYLLVNGNNVALIERIGLRTGHIQEYLNNLILKSGMPENQVRWKLIPKIEMASGSVLQGGVEKIILKPQAALSGEGESQTKKKKRGYQRKIDEMISNGPRILDLLKALGANEARIEKLRESMSEDLVLRARVEVSVSRAERASEAQISPDDISIAFAELSEMNDIDVVSKDGRSSGKLIQLSHLMEVKQKNGIIELKHAIPALAASLQSWAAKGAIELSP
tara:strand:+ start:404 stop:1318 length:915 start_codon:yes stop_codon:yes gene_type:complete